MTKMFYKNQTRAGVTVTGRGKPIKAPVSWNTQDAPGRAGTILVSKNVEPLTFPVHIMIEGESAEDYRRKCEDAAAWLNSDHAEPLSFSDDPNRTFYAVVTGSIDPDELILYGEMDITFFVPDGYRYGLRQTRDFTSIVEFSNEGTADALPVYSIRFTAAQTNFILRTNGIEFRLIRSFVAGDVVTIDSIQQVVKLNGADAMPIRDWRTPFKRTFLPPGTNTVTLTGSVVAELVYTERFQ